MFVLENVKNLVNHDKGNTFKVIRETLEEELGYNVTCRVVDAKGYVPQHRERIFIVGYRDGKGVSLDSMDVPDSRRGPKLATILHPEDGTEESEDRYIDKSGKVNKRYVLTSHMWRYLRDYAEKHRRRGNGFGYGLVGPEDVARTMSARYYKDGSEILIKRGRGNPRRLTPRECARLMGFDRPGKKFRIPVSDTQAYKQFGNAVVATVGDAVARHSLSPLLGV